MRTFGAGALVLAVALAPLQAFACTLVLQTPGTLRNSMDNTMLGSEVNGNTPATVNALLALFESPTIQVSAPSRITPPPAGYNTAAETVQVRYTAGVIAGGGLADQPYTSSTTSFPLGLLGLVTVSMTVHSRILNANGFAAGTYTTRTVVTCHP
jgi:hypothetical protein